MKAASLSFTERGKYLQFMHLPSPPERSLLGQGHPQLQDCSTHEEQARGNMPLAFIDAKPQDRIMTEQQWSAFASLRAFPCLQIIHLTGELERDSLVLERPEVYNSCSCS
jgi:hypothetical protein